MTRSRSSARNAGGQFEHIQARYLSETVDDRIEVRKTNGVRDRGDIAAVRDPHGNRVALECKEYGGRFLVATWLAEAEAERVNDGAAWSAVIAKKRGTRNPGDQVVFMTMRDLAALLSGTRPD